MLDIAYGNGIFVAVGYGGVTMTSSNGISWTVQNSIEKPHIYDLAFGNGRFVAVQAVPNPGTNLLSTDGISWAEADAPIRFEGIGFANGQFVGGGYTGSEFRIYSSPDGTGWTRHGSLPGNITQVIYADGQYLACGYSGRFYSSADLEEWRVSDTGTGFACYGLCYGNGQYVSVGTFAGVLVSTNGSNWNQKVVDAGGDYNDIVYVGGRFVAVGKVSQYLVSEDGVNWSGGVIPHTPGIAFSYNGIAFGDGVFVAVGSRGAVSTSSNGVDWVLRSRGTIEDLFSVTYTGREWTAAGWLQEVITSSNGVDWITLRNQQPFWFSEINYANGYYHASLGIVIDSSTNGANWTESLLPVEPGERAGINGYAYGSDRWVGVGIGGNIWTSENAYHWTRQQSGVGLDLNSVTFANGQFVAVGTQGQIITSTNGLSWSRSVSATTIHLNSVAHGNGIFVAVGVEGTALRSPDGVNWNIGNTGVPVVLTDVAYGAGYFVAVGTFGAVFTSTNGSDWTLQDSGTSQTLFSVAYGNQSFLAVGDDGTIVQSDPLLYLELLDVPFATVSVTGPQGGLVRLEVTDSPALTASWQPAGLLLIDDVSAKLWRDTNASSNVSRFYRAALLP